MSKLLEGVFNAPIQKAVRQHINKAWEITGAKANDTAAMHDTAIFIGNSFDIFVKAGANPYSYDQFIQEAWGLNHIRQHSSVYTPEVIDVLNVDGTALLIMEAIDIKPVESDKDWSVLGQGLATLHKATWDHCGLETHSYLGIFRQDNTPMDSWTDFFAQRRLGDSFKMAAEARKITPDEIGQVREALDRLIERLPEISGPSQPFSLLHGDPWVGNLLYDGRRLVLIDCSIYYGNREMDLSTVDLFCPVPKAFFAGYHDCYPIEAGYEARKSLWRINQWLGHITIFGSDYMPQLMGAIRQYL